MLSLTLSLALTLKLTVGLFHIKSPLLALIWKNPSHMTVRIGLSNPQINEPSDYQYITIRVRVNETSYCRPTMQSMMLAAESDLMNNIPCSPTNPTFPLGPGGPGGPVGPVLGDPCSPCRP